MQTKLTPEQEKQIKIYLDKYIKLGTNTDSTNKNKVIDCITTLYKLNALEKPDIMFFDSPKGSLTYLKSLDKHVDVHIWFLGAFDNYWLGYYSFINEVLNIPLDSLTQQKFTCFKELCNETNFMYLYDKLAVISEKPIYIELDSAGRLHSDNRAAIEFKDGYKVFSTHGIRHKAWITEHPETITKKSIHEETNAEIRRVMISKMGVDKFMEGATIIDADFETLPNGLKAQRQLLLEKNGTDEPIVRLKVTNHTPEKDGTLKHYFLPVDFECRPVFPGINGKELDIALEKCKNMTREELISNKFLGDPQKLTCHNAVASTFGKYGHEYGLLGQIRQGDVFIDFKDGSNRRKFRES